MMHYKVANIHIGLSCFIWSLSITCFWIRRYLEASTSEIGLSNRLETQEGDNYYPRGWMTDFNVGKVKIPRIDNRSLKPQNGSL